MPGVDQCLPSACPLPLAAPCAAEGQSCSTIQAFTHFSLHWLGKQLGCPAIVLDAQVRRRRKGRCGLVLCAVCRQA